MSLTAPVAMLVSAGDGIGAGVARKFASEGYTVCIIRRNVAKSNALFKELASLGQDVRVFSADVRKEADVHAVFATVEETVGPIEFCLFNGGANSAMPILETTETFFYKVWAFAALAAFFAGREAAKYMVSRGRGTIVFTGATASLRGRSGLAAFAGAKFAVRALAQAMARELGPKNIHVAHLIIDGGIESEVVFNRMKNLQGIERSSIAPDSLSKPSSIAEAYWFLHNQSKDAWTQELDIRSSVEPW